MYPSTKEVLKKGITYFRTDEYSEITNACLAKLAKLIGNENPNSLIYLAASGTAAMEAVVENCVNENDKALVINGGTFGKRFCDLLKYHNIAHESINLAWGETLTKEHLSPYINKNFTTMFVNIHETSTGQLYDIQMLSEFCKKKNMFLIVDAISSFMADDYNMNKYGIDVTIISSQKGLCLSPGMSMVSFSQRMLEKVKNNNKVSSWYFDFKDYLKNIERGQTPYTPAVCIMYELQDILKIIEETGGKEAWLDIIKEKALYFRKKAKELGFKIPDYPLSNMLTPLIFEDVSAYEVIQVLKNKYRLFVNPCGGELAHKLMRISHIGNTTKEDIDDLLEKMILSINEVKLQGALV
ncbi:alanine--glyoxylate aminotransferase family protein [bacterium]|nr:alanine--glyoxylate aminotransferase family protein [bacterium]MBQ9149521.1 alanine--glyoxylate aminotransferase family protein [bacterium]